jgi:hypothetical protein
MLPTMVKTRLALVRRDCVDECPIDILYEGSDTLLHLFSTIHSLT